MTHILHLETSYVQLCADQIKQYNRLVEETMRQTIFSVRSLDWYGPNRDQFQIEAEYLIQKLLLLTSDGLVLATRLQLEIAKWESLDYFFLRQFSELVTGLHPRDR